MLIDPRNIQSGRHEDPGTVTVERFRWRGFDTPDNIFVLYEKPRINVTALLLEPFAWDYTASEFGGRLIEESRAKSVLTGGTICSCRKPATRDQWIINLQFIDDLRCNVDQIAHLLAVSFNHDDLSDFRCAPLTYRNEPFLDVSTISELIRRYFKQADRDYRYGG